MSERAATWLFVPGDRPERFAKAAASGADQVILDLEDAVTPEAKQPARGHVSGWLADHTAWVRVNATGEHDIEHDIHALAGRPGLRGVLVPKAESPEALTAIGRRLGVPLVALIESALGLERSREIARAEGVTRLAFGSIDFALDIGARHTREALASARRELVLVSRLAALPAPIDGVTAEVSDESRARDDADHARELGFGGKLCIHPRQVEQVRLAFAPSPEELAWAREVIAAATGAGAVQVGGAMIDRPVVERARRLLAAAAGSTGDQ
ncbi:HpcH/HpaI aldolase/citrate lyase family protein [Nocardioides sp.]|uniref:HpcH/HpaI aldolase/citrate lyase family protein n=1 Tax=Nocardioides sp. TaxID=35761 RepID=UPI0039E3B60D